MPRAGDPGRGRQTRPRHLDSLPGVVDRADAGEPAPAGDWRRDRAGEPGTSQPLGLLEAAAGAGVPAPLHPAPGDAGHGTRSSRALGRLVVLHDRRREAGVLLRLRDGGAGAGREDSGTRVEARHGPLGRILGAGDVGLRGVVLGARVGGGGGQGLEVGLGGRRRGGGGTSRRLGVEELKGPGSNLRDLLLEKRCTSSRSFSCGGG